MESTTNSISLGSTADFTSLSSCISSSSICNLPAVSIIITLLPSFLPCLIAALAISTGDTLSPIVNTGISICLPTTCNCLIDAGLYISHATNKGFLLSFLN